MITEIARIEVTPGNEDDFEHAVAQALPLIRTASGCLGVRVVRSTERPERYRLLVDWETIEHHTQTFRSSDSFDRWRELTSAYYAAPPVVEHVYDLPLS